MHFRAHYTSSYTGIRPFYDRAAASRKEELGVDPYGQPDRKNTTPLVSIEILLSFRLCRKLKRSEVIEMCLFLRISNSGPTIVIYPPE